jgi:hypothetical protein
MYEEYRDDRRRGKFIIVIGLLLAIAAGGAAFYVVNQATQSAGQTELQKVAIVVAVRAIPARQPIVAEDVAIREVPLDPTNETGVITDPTQVVGRIPAVSILQNQPVTQNMLASSQEGAEFSILGPDETVAPDSEYWRAVSITVPADLAAAGKFATDRSTKIVYQNVLILARKDAFYIIKAPLWMAEELAHMQAVGTATMSMVLRPDQDLRPIDASKLGETTNRIIEKYGLPIPQNFPSGRLPAQLPVASPTPFPTPGPSDSPAPSASPATP